MARLHHVRTVALALALGGCASPPGPPVLAVPTATLVPLRMRPCPSRPSSPATATGCPRPPS